MKKNPSPFQELVFTAFGFFLSAGFLVGQTSDPDPREEDEQPPFSVVYHLLPDVDGSYENFAYAINQEGKIAGETHFAIYGASPIGAIWWPTSNTDEGYSPTYSWGSSYDINDSGKVAPGLDYGPSYDLPDSETGTGGGFGMAINNSDEVVGTGWESRQKDGPWVMDPNGEGGHNSWYKVTTQTFPAKVLPEIATKLGGAHKSTDVLTVQNDGTQTIKTPKNAGIAWSIDDKGFCVGIDVDGIAVWNYGTGYRKEPAGAEKRLISISPEGVVCGTSSEGPAFWAKHGEGAKVVLPLPADAGEGDHFVTAVSDTGWVVGQVNGRINLKEDRQWKGGRAFAWKKEGVDETGKPTWTMMDLAKFAPKSWRHLTIFDVNRSGKAVGFAQVKGKYCAVMIELGPQLIAIDANRDGETLFEDDLRIVEDSSLSDLTSEKKPFHFWINDDEDLDDGGEKVPPVKANFSDHLINGNRDLEDFYRFKIRLEPEWKQKLKDKYSLKIEIIGNAKINIFKAVKSEFETGYLENKEVANRQNSFVGRLTKDQQNHVEKLLTADDYAEKSALFLWEGAKKGGCEIRISLCRPNGITENSSKICLDLYPVKNFFECVEATSDELFAPPYETDDGSVPEMIIEKVHEEKIKKWKGEEDHEAIVFVHGWRMPDQEALNWGEIMYKRLWHSGFKGKFFYFRWATYSEDESIFKGFFTYNKSEHRAWVSGKSLADYLKSKRAELPKDYTLGLCAHSMGNIVAGEAVKQGAPVDSYVMMQAAVPACCYDERKSLCNSLLTAVEAVTPTPQLAIDMGYIGYLKGNKVPLYNFYNEKDFAMSLFLVDELGFKTDPVHIAGYGRYRYINGVPGIYSNYGYENLIREVTEPYECMAFLARTVTSPIGGERRTLYKDGAEIFPLKERYDLSAAYGFGRMPGDHSAQFNRSIQQGMIPFFTKLRTSLITKTK